MIRGFVSAMYAARVERAGATGATVVTLVRLRVVALFVPTLWGVSLSHVENFGDRLGQAIVMVDPVRSDLDDVDHRHWSRGPAHGLWAWLHRLAHVFGQYRA